jgi:hypothetical protein
LTYSVNRGEKIVMTEEVGHTPAFWDNFRELLSVAVEPVPFYVLYYTSVIVRLNI